MRPLTAIAFLAATGLAACSGYDGSHSVDLSLYQSPQQNHVANLGYSTSMSHNLVASFTLTGVGYGDRTPIMTNREPYPNLAPTTYSGRQRSSTEQSQSEPHSAGISLAHALLASQNSVRAAVGEGPLIWSTRLADAAQEWANHLIATGAFKHHLDGQYGENLYDITGGTATPQHVVSKWAGEIHDYDIQTNSCFGDTDCGHYTQIVWSTTRAVGCALAAASNRQVWVCEYYPAGNIIGYRPYRLAMNQR